MLHTMLDVKEHKVADVLPSGDPNVFMQELTELYERTTGKKADFQSVEDARAKVRVALEAKFFREEGTPVQPHRGGGYREYDTTPVRPPWLKEDGTPTANPPRQVQTHEGEEHPEATDYDGRVNPDGPVAKARAIFEKMWGSPRKDIIEACAQVGIKRSTASTQYQHFKKAKEHSVEYRNSQTNMPQLAPGTRAGDQQPNQ